MLRKTHALVSATTDMLGQVEEAQQYARETVTDYEDEMRREHEVY